MLSLCPCFCRALVQLRACCARPSPSRSSVRAISTAAWRRTGCCRSKETFDPTALEQVRERTNRQTRRTALTCIHMQLLRGSAPSASSRSAAPCSCPLLQPQARKFDCPARASRGRMCTNSEHCMTRCTGQRARSACARYTTRYGDGGAPECGRLQSGCRAGLQASDSSSADVFRLVLSFALAGRPETSSVQIVLVTQRTACCRCWIAIAS